MVDPDTNKMLVFDDFLQAVLHATKYGVSADVIDYIQLKELKDTGKITSKYSGSWSKDRKAEANRTAA